MFGFLSSTLGYLSGTAAAQQAPEPTTTAVPQEQHADLVIQEEGTKPQNGTTACAETFVTPSEGVQTRYVTPYESFESGERHAHPFGELPTVSEDDNNDKAYGNAGAGDRDDNVDANKSPNDQNFEGSGPDKGFQKPAQKPYDTEVPPPHGTKGIGRLTAHPPSAYEDGELTEVQRKRVAERWNASMRALNEVFKLADAVLGRGLSGSHVEPVPDEGKYEHTSNGFDVDVQDPVVIEPSVVDNVGDDYNQYGQNQYDQNLDQVSYDANGHQTQDGLDNGYEVEGVDTSDYGSPGSRWYDETDDFGDVEVLNSEAMYMAPAGLEFVRPDDDVVESVEDPDTGAKIESVHTEDEPSSGDDQGIVSPDSD